MSKATDPLIDSAVALASVWAGALTGFGEQIGEHPDAAAAGGLGAGSIAPGASFGAIAVARAQLDVETMSDAGLLRAIRSGYDLKRQVDALLVRAVGELSVRSRPSLGQGGLAKSSGHTSPEALVTELGRVTLAEAGKTVRLGRRPPRRCPCSGSACRPRSRWSPTRSTPASCRSMRPSRSSTT